MLYKKFSDIKTMHDKILSLVFRVDIYPTPMFTATWRIQKNTSIPSAPSKDRTMSDYRQGKRIISPLSKQAYRLHLYWQN